MRLIELFLPARTQLNFISSQMKWRKRYWTVRKLQSDPSLLTNIKNNLQVLSGERDRGDKMN